jgi:hypothetical protein
VAGLAILSSGESVAKSFPVRLIGVALGDALLPEAISRLVELALKAKR